MTLKTVFRHSLDRVVNLFTEARFLIKKAQTQIVEISVFIKKKNYYSFG